MWESVELRDVRVFLTLCDELAEPIASQPNRQDFGAARWRAVVRSHEQERAADPAR